MAPSHLSVRRGSARKVRATVAAACACCAHAARILDPAAAVVVLVLVLGMVVAVLEVEGMVCQGFRENENLDIDI